MILKTNWSPGGQPYCGFSVTRLSFQSPGVNWATVKFELCIMMTSVDSDTPSNFKCCTHKVLVDGTNPHWMLMHLATVKGHHSGVFTIATLMLMAKSVM